MEKQSHSHALESIFGLSLRRIHRVFWGMKCCRETSLGVLFILRTQSRQTALHLQQNCRKSQCLRAENGVGPSAANSNVWSEGMKLRNKMFPLHNPSRPRRPWGPTTVPLGNYKLLRVQEKLKSAASVTGNFVHSSVIETLLWYTYRFEENWSTDNHSLETWVDMETEMFINFCMTQDLRLSKFYLLSYNGV
jgi:hypothetical protein